MYLLHHVREWIISHEELVGEFNLSHECKEQIETTQGRLEAITLQQVSSMRGFE